MRLITGLVMVLVLFSTVAFGQKSKFVQPTKNNVGIYENEVRRVNEQAKFKVGVEERLQVMQTKRNHYKVKTADGDVGWIEKRFVVATSGKKFMFDDAEVIGYLDNPTPVYIIDADSKDATPIKLDRSFADALRQNVDRETVERQVK
ncbi:MAG: hypothetical protein GF418_03015 [Chitinivibrionales bacterium]|nr:hypothetical protein [Chitinivibrionales bacterium]MBD3394573.1 hypothetical protein [Chitinivibrionales bacterium]